MSRLVTISDLFRDRMSRGLGQAGDMSEADYYPSFDSGGGVDWGGVLASSIDKGINIFGNIATTQWGTPPAGTSIVRTPTTTMISSGGRPLNYGTYGGAAAGFSTGTMIAIGVGAVVALAAISRMGGK